MSNKHSLKHINIENLFGTDTKTSCTNGKLDINTLFKKPDNDVNFEFDSDVLLKGIRQRKKKLKETYANFYKNCCEIITKASDAGMTDLLFEIPNNVIDCIDYSPYDCLIFIKEKLALQCISSHIKSKRKLFITWYELEKKLYKKNKELEKIENINTLTNKTDCSSFTAP